jgi:hypothetical protein
MLADKKAMPYTEQEQIVLAVLPKISATLAFFSDCWIITEVITDKSKKPKRTKPYHRLLFAMSFYGSLESCANFASTWPMPRGTPSVYGAIGTQQTCTFQGVLLCFAIAVPMYNACLSLYYLLVIKYGWRDEALKRCVEPSMHLFIFGFTVSTAIYTLSTTLINPANFWCSLAPYPSNCLDSWRYSDKGNCIRGDNAWIYRWAFLFTPLWLCILLASKFLCVILYAHLIHQYHCI